MRPRRRAQSDVGDMSRLQCVAPRAHVSRAGIDQQEAAAPHRQADRKLVAGRVGAGGMDHRPGRPAKRSLRALHGPRGRSRSRNIVVVADDCDRREQRSFEELARHYGTGAPVQRCRSRRAETRAGSTCLIARPVRSVRRTELDQPVDLVGLATIAATSRELPVGPGGEAEERSLTSEAPALTSHVRHRGTASADGGVRNDHRRQRRSISGACCALMFVQQLEDARTSLPISASHLGQQFGGCARPQPMLEIFPPRRIRSAVKGSRECYTRCPRPGQPLDGGDGDVDQFVRSCANHHGAAGVHPLRQHRELLVAEQRNANPRGSAPLRRSDQQTERVWFGSALRNHSGRPLPKLRRNLSQFRPPAGSATRPAGSEEQRERGRSLGVPRGAWARRHGAGHDGSPSMHGRGWSSARRRWASARLSAPVRPVLAVAFVAKENAI